MKFKKDILKPIQKDIDSLWAQTTRRTKHVISVPPKHLINKKKMLYWQSWKEGDIEYFTEIGYFKAPMWIYYLLRRTIDSLEALKRKLTYHWEAEWRIPVIDSCTSYLGHKGLSKDKNICKYCHQKI